MDLHDVVFLALGQASMARNPDQVARIGEALIKAIDAARPAPPPEAARTEISNTMAAIGARRPVQARVRIRPCPVNPRPSLSAQRVSLLFWSPR